MHIITGWIFDVTQNYNIPFLVSALIAFIGSILMLILFIVMRRRDTKQQIEKASKLNDTNEKNAAVPMLQQVQEVESKRTRTYTF